ncbi:HSD17B2 [Acanthosepion pharaonis]|uniref:HSD17B2 n=1 Tax=Acanthosepion pharaonis TaxID=158019 RepID=A0A812CGP1_ACAPH|nr:HSD17B2 [Sepia pharaonis]
MTSEEIFQKTLNVNLLGTFRLTKAFLPFIRRAKGRIINMSSFAARVPMNGISAYSVSKSAILAFSDILRLEMKKWDVHVSIIEPVGFRTNAFNEQVLEARLQEIWDSLDEECQIVYGRQYLEDLYSSYKELIPRVPSDLSPVVSAVCNSLLSKNPRERYPCGQGADILATLFAILPIRLADKVSKFMSVIPKNSRPLALEPSSHLVP